MNLKKEEAMNLQKYRILGTVATLAWSGTLIGAGVAAAQQDNSSAGAEVLTRGPVHEAFAGTVSYDPEPGALIDQQPPTAIEEVPPEQRLEGDNVAWIPGYWAWDEDQSDFIWVSGIWRNLPPGRQWVPGYWADADGRHQWTSGYWEDAEATEVSYLPKPPRSVESGPNIKAPSRDQSWMPGSWAWRDDRYAWRAGYWAPVRENWIWTPSYYRWTRRGYVYVDGYWDYAVARRGVIFAPVRFERDYYSRPDYYYTPSTVINLAVIVNNLFLRPSYGHYYFGDYYGSSYRDHGYYASYSYNSGRHGYDPIYNHYRWENRDDRNWEDGRREYFEYRRDHEDSRPPRTWAALNARSEDDRRRGGYADMAEPLDRLVKKGDVGKQRFQQVDKQDRERFVSQKKEIQEYGKERKKLEGEKSKDDSSGEGRPSHVKMDRSPVAAKLSDRGGKGDAPPERLEARGSEQGKGKSKGDKSKGDKTEAMTGPGTDTTGEPADGKDGSKNRKGGDPSVNPKTEDQSSKRKGDESSSKRKNEEQVPTPKTEDQSSKRKGDESSSKRKNEEQAPTPKTEDQSSKRKGDDSSSKRKNEEQPSTPKADEQSSKRKSEPRQAEPQPEPKRKSEPRPDREIQDKPKATPRQVEPSQSRQSEPAPSRKTEQRRADPEPTQRAERKSQPQVEQAPRRVEPAQPQRQQVERAPQRVEQERSAPKREQQPSEPRSEPTSDQGKHKSKKDTAPE